MGAGGRLYIQISINLVLSHDSTSNSPASPRTVEIWPVRVRRRFPVARSQIFMVRSPKGFSQSTSRFVISHASMSCLPAPLANH